MRIDVELTPQDWRAFIRFYMERMGGHRRAFWLWLLGSAAFVFGLLWVFDHLLGRRIDLFSMLFSVGLIVVFILVQSRTQRAIEAIPEVWLGRHVYDLLPDGMHTQGAAGTAHFPWTAIKEVCEEPGHVYLLLDRVTTITLPKRAMESLGGAAAVTAEIARLRAAANESGSPAGHATFAGSSEVAVISGNTSTPIAANTRSEEKPHPTSRLPSLLNNLVAGLRMAFFLPVHGQHFRPAVAQSVVLLLITLGIWIVVERLLADDNVYFAWYSFAQVGWLTAVACAALLLMAPGPQSPGAAGRMFTAFAATAPFVVLIGVLALSLPIQYPATLVRQALLVLYVFVLAIRVQRVSISENRPLAYARAVLALGAVYLAFSHSVWQRPHLWYASDSHEEYEQTFEAAERDLFSQPDVIDAAVERLSSGTAGETDVYFVGFAGYGEQAVFGKEIRYANRAFGSRMELEGRSLQLINTPDERDPAVPLATTSGLKRSLAGVARKMNVEEDVLVLFLTSHGSQDAELSVSQGVLPLDQLGGEGLRAALDESGIQWRIVVISACHAGSFIPLLSTPRTMIITAAHADRNSFGCSDERELTYFGEAFLRDALPVSANLIEAYENANRVVTARELKEGHKPSDPQLFVGEEIRAKLAEVALGPIAPRR
jgi:hypothetical protein